MLPKVKLEYQSENDFVHLLLVCCVFAFMFVAAILTFENSSYNWKSWIALLSIVGLWAFFTLNVIVKSKVSLSSFGALKVSGRVFYHGLDGPLSYEGESKCWNPARYKFRRAPKSDVPHVILTAEHLESLYYYK